MRILDLALNDLLQIVRDWKAAFFLIVMPLAFTLVFGFAFGGISEDDDMTDSRIQVGLVDKDKSIFSQGVINLAETAGGIRLESISEDIPLDELEKQVKDDKMIAVLLIPEGFSEAFFHSEPLELITILKPETASGASALYHLQVVANRLNQSIESAIFSTAFFETRYVNADDSVLRDYFNDSFQMAVLSWENPPLVLQTPELISENTKGVGNTTNAFTHSSPGMMVQFALAGLIGAAEVLVLERKSGSLHRLLTTSIFRSEILLGHFLAMCLMIFIQFAILIAFAQLALDVPYFSAPLATFLVTIATTLFAASMGLLIGTMAKSPDQVIIFSLIPMFIFSGLGGAWMPLEFTSQTFQTIGHFTPLAWAMDGYQNIIIRGMGIESTLIPIAVLLGFAGICFFLAIWRFKFE